MSNGLVETNLALPDKSFFDQKMIVKATNGLNYSIRHDHLNNLFRFLKNKIERLPTVLHNLFVVLSQMPN
jgi:hypothetical protein